MSGLLRTNRRAPARHRADVGVPDFLGPLRQSPTPEDGLVFEGFACCPSGAWLRRSGSSLPLARRDSADPLEMTTGGHGYSERAKLDRARYPERSQRACRRSQLRLRRAPWTISAFRADALMASPSWKSMARTVLLSKRVLKSPFGSFSWAPFGNVSLTAFLRASPMQTMPSWDQTGTPSGREGFFHFTSSITPGSAPLMRARSWLSLSPLQPAVLRTMSSICWDADASLISTLCCGCSAPSGPKGSVPCPCGGCSQANNTASASPPTARIAIAGCAGSSFLLSLARAPSRSIHCGQEG